VGKFQKIREEKEQNQQFSRTQASAKQPPLASEVRQYRSNESGGSLVPAYAE
jgi:hypothetical protein